MAFKPELIRPRLFPLALLLFLAISLSYLQNCHCFSTQCTKVPVFAASDFSISSNICQNKLCEFYTVEGEENMYVNASFCGGKVCAIQIASIDLYQNCTCDAVLNAAAANNGGSSTFYDHTVQLDGVTGILSLRECGAISYITEWAEHRAREIEREVLHVDATTERRGRFTYVEAGSFMGLSVHIVMSTLRRSNIAGEGFSHDLFSLDSDSRSSSPLTGLALE